ncbi:hypothetical protein DAEQUDRAFT_729766 [Daedalea quercina L-15889]|uniref:DUF6534 domain-containing protein n=1 Tax=Daedalea quercina L-15889 TaxID=1314783 RepID=A0A165NH47_9APHY|nr:hypothetical protein DAEQUDRAFT_729766 [Daedalea quercina L-15889]
MTTFDTSIGCFFIGIIISALMYGCTVGQVLYYIGNYKEDRWGFKLFVLFLWASDTVATVLAASFIWEYLIQDHADPTKLTILTNEVVAEYMITTVIILVVQVYYTLAIWRLINSNMYKILVSSIVLIISLISFAFGIENTSKIAQDPHVPQVYSSIEGPATAQPLLACIADIYITIALSWLLQRERTMFARTDTIINTLTMWAINRGVLTSALQTAQAISYIAASKSVFYWSIFHFAGGKAYVNSALAILNARNFIRDGGKTVQKGSRDHYAMQELSSNSR